MNRTWLIAAVTVALTACDSKLELTNPNFPTTATYWKNAAQADAGTVAIYNALALEGTYTRSFPGLSDSRGDDVQGSSPWTDLVQVGRFTIPSNSAPVEWIWRDHYIIINRANQVLKNVPDIADAEFTDGHKNRILGQAYFLRAFAYFNLINTFQKVPLVTQPPEGKEQYYPATASPEEVWKQIVEDLKQAEVLLPLSYKDVTGPDAGQTGRATKGAAAGLLGKVYMYTKQFAAAVEQFEKFTKAGGELHNVYQLMADYRHNFDTQHENNAESLFEIQFTAEGGTDGNWAGEPNANWRQFCALAVTYAPPGESWGGYKDYEPSPGLYTAFKKEKTVDGKSDPRLLATIASYEAADNSTKIYGRDWPYASRDVKYLRKWTHDGLDILEKESFESGGINYRVLRYADILLLYAEALNEVNRTAEAYTYIQQVRDRAKLPALASSKPNMNQVQMREQIAHERLLEFAVEGQRIQDIIRWGWLYDQTKLAELRTRDSDFNSWRAGREYLPIPFNELNYNKNLSPNSAN
ncbi:RagB/SusD family nutrient uptake outer membrane protein [Sphingobacterium thalpophilum]|uniref:SusD family n=1 Tax=Sphingobacterium thalpophilum TaxID=259 RepID=A0A4U9UMM7_9SPHI|nr:RagB/SusD family nutrient uptake outer membrane protein [Sphingobacterium thalpophilum]VTR34273.1 SusD family [Sphingobacterium thalpophilum]